jgi:hypothetical protein
MDGRKGAGKLRELCACGRPVWAGTRHQQGEGRCVTCAEALIRADTVRRLTKSGAMAAMRRALEACPDAHRTEPEPLRELTEAEELARAFVVGMANAETEAQTDGEYSLQPRRKSMRSGDAVVAPSLIPWNVTAVGLKYTGKH